MVTGLREGAPQMERIPASERTREKLRTLIEGRGEVEDERSELV